MPAPSRTSLEAIVAAGTALLEEAGPDGLTMQAVATRVGVRAPSLYKRVAGRDALVRLVAEAAVRDLTEVLEAATPPDADPAAALVDLAHALRRFAHARPAAFRLIFWSSAEATRPSPELNARAVAPVLRVCAALAGEDRALEAARTVTAWAAGFVGMELADAFRSGGDVDEAFEFGARRLAGAIAAG